MRNNLWLWIGGIVVAAAVYGGCEITGSDPFGSSVRLVTGAGRGCTGTRSEAGTLAWQLEADTLLLSFFFDANCCSGYVEEVSTGGSAIYISLDDTSHTACRCMCTFQEDMAFDVGDRRTVDIQAEVRHQGQEDYVMLADTTLQLRGVIP